MGKSTIDVYGLEQPQPTRQPVPSTQHKEAQVKRDDLTTYLDNYLRVKEIDDSSQNGLQVEGPEEMTKVAFAVDSCQAAFKRAVAAGAQLLIVHHGLFWDKPLRLVGPLFRRVKTLIEGDCGLYAAHLPLDLHPEVGNNAELARLLGLKDTRAFGEHRGHKIGLGGVLDQPIPLSVLIERLARATGEPPLRVFAHGPAEASQVGCISGWGADLMDQVADAGFDTFVTGEASHTFFHQAAEWGLNVVYGGHYATETLGLKALARHLGEKFGLETTFLDVPTGM
ncbi:MAG TPA: Nif3-like dinuclear metal center hexameric protein [Anaerolineae bacterium]|nr:Nif3-like dinuclear metal center hexameric protein [Anaerolineae bacterium]